MTAEINEFSVFGEMLRAMGRTGHHQVDLSLTFTYFTRLYVFATRHCRWWRYVFRLSHSFVHRPGQILLRRYLVNVLNNSDKTDREYLLAHTDDCLDSGGQRSMSHRG